MDNAIQTHSEKLKVSSKLIVFLCLPFLADLSKQIIQQSRSDANRFLKFFSYPQSTANISVTMIIGMPVTIL